MPASSKKVKTTPSKRKGKFILYFNMILFIDKKKSTPSTPDKKRDFVWVHGKRREIRNVTKDSSCDDASWKIMKEILYENWLDESLSKD